MRGDGEEVWTRGVVSAEHERGTNVALVLEEALLEHGHRRHHARLASRVELVQLHVARDELRDKLGIRRRTRTTAADVVRDVVDLFAVLIRHDGAFGSTCIGTEDDAVLEDASDNRRARRRGGESSEPLRGEEGVARVVGEVEPGVEPVPADVCAVAAAIVDSWMRGMVEGWGWWCW